MNYYGDKTEKVGIILHDTRSPDARKSIEYLKGENKKRDYPIMVHYWITKEGEVINTIPLECWAFHSGTGREVDKYTISIELENEGMLRLEGEEFVDYYGNVYKGEVYDNKVKWRGWRYFACYTQGQVDSLKNLFDYICEKYWINPIFPASLCPEKPMHITSIKESKYKILSHSNIRGDDKLDLSPAIKPFYEEIIDWSRW